MTSEHPDREGFGEATLGEAQSQDPPSDPEMIDDSELEELADLDEAAVEDVGDYEQE